MRRLIIALTLFVSACATRPQESAAPPATVQTQQPVRSQLIGLTAAQLISVFGSPALQVREGSSLKLQFRKPACILDAYLYPSGGQLPKVTYVDTRLPSGADTDQAACVAALSGNS